MSAHLDECEADGRDAWRAAGGDATCPWPQGSREANRWVIGYLEERRDELEGQS